jgi:UDP-GlcNAc:undecaprenyl-phosphate GlcNAc-1-phosphate transferase
VQLDSQLIYLVPLVSGVVISMAIIPVMIRLAPYLGLMDRPNERKVHTTSIPRVGGIGIVIGSLLSIYLLVDISRETHGYILGSMLIFLFGLWDDKREIGHYVKFMGQFASTLAVVVYGGLYVTRFPFFDKVALPIYIGVPFTVIAIMGMINAINHSDGLDGLAGGESLISLCALAFLFYFTGSTQNVVITLAVIGGIFGFLRYNTHPAKVFMGDSGSQFLGFTLAFLVLMLTQRADRSLSPTVVLLLLGLPIVDIITVLIIRMRSGMNWFLATRNHTHHRLLDLGFVHQESVVIIYAVQTACVTAGILLRHHSGWIILAVYLLLCVGMLMMIVSAEKRGWQYKNRSPFDEMNSAVSQERIKRFLVVMPRRFLSFSVPFYIVFMSFIVTTVPRDFAVMSGLAFSLMGVEVLFKTGPRSITRRALIYIIAVSVVYLGVNYSPNVLLDMNLVETVFFTLLAIAFAVSVKFSPGRRKVEFNTTPMDYLVVVVMVASLIASKGEVWGNNTLLFVVEMIIILYTCELLSTENRDQWNGLSVAVFIASMVLFFRGFF